MSSGKAPGAADDASAYEDFPEPEGPPSRRRPRPRAKSGIASDGDMFVDILAETTDARQSLNTNWLYQQGGQVFGPVKPKELLEMLYQGEITPDTSVACEEDGFQPLRRYGVFRAHLPKVEAHQKELLEAKEQERKEARARLMRRLGLGAGAISIAVLLSLGLAYYIRSSRQKAAIAEKQAKEDAIKLQLENLMASVTIEPPLMPLVEDDPQPTKAPKKGRRRRRRARFSSPKGKGELTRSEIMGGVAKVFGGFKRCIVQQMQRESESVPEQIVLTFVIDNSGRAKNVSITDRFLRKSPLRNCVAARLSKARWRAFKGEVQNVEYPITIGRR